jgi:hypothetical protein
MLGALSLVNLTTREVGTIFPIVEVRKRSLIEAW